MAKLYFYYSAMNAGKTTTLLQSAHNYRERGLRVAIHTPRLDDRAGSGTVASARDWIELERIRAGLLPDPAADRLHDLEGQTLALIAHDAMKPQMMAFAAENFDLLSRFARRVATGTTGQRLNELAWSRGWPQGRSWVHRYQSGPMGGDAQIADLVLERRCQRAIFFEDPHVARQHEADIQLLERAVTTVTDEAVCITAPAVAQRWASAAAERARRR